MNATPTTNFEPITEGQVGELLELLGAGLSAHSADFPSDSIQLVIEQEGELLQAELLAVIRKRVENRAGMIVRKVVVNRDLSPQEMLDATKRAPFIDYRSTINSIPQGGVGIEEVTVEFFALEGDVTDKELNREYARRGLRPDPYAQIQVNIDDPDFANQYPNFTHWKNSDGDWCSVGFKQCDDGSRRVYVHCYDGLWRKGYWFGGVRK